MDNPPPIPAPPFRPLVLLVDDVPANLQVLGNLLQEENLEIAMASSGEDALAFVQEDLPDLILLDVMMPGMDGYEVCRRLKQDLRTASVPVIFLTAKASPDDVVRGFEAGGVDYVAKPFHAPELRARVRTHLHLHQLQSILHVCMHCRRIHDEDGSWEKVDVYLRRHAGVHISHGLCPECMKTHYGIENGTP